MKKRKSAVAVLASSWGKHISCKSRKVQWGGGGKPKASRKINGKRRKAKSVLPSDAVGEREREDGPWLPCCPLEQEGELNWDLALEEACHLVLAKQLSLEAWGAKASFMEQAAPKKKHVFGPEEVSAVLAPAG